MRPAPLRASLAGLLAFGAPAFGQYGPYRSAPAAPYPPGGVPRVYQYRSNYGPSPYRGEYPVYPGQPYPNGPVASPGDLYDPSGGYSAQPVYPYQAPSYDPGY